VHLGEISLECSPGRRCGRGFVGHAAAYAGLCREASLPEASRNGRAAALNLDRKLREDRTGRFHRSQPGAAATGYCGCGKPEGGDFQNNPPSWRQKVLMRAPRGILHLALVQLPLKWFEPATGLEPESLGGKRRGVGDLACARY